jgi:hypothetical protein
MAAPRYKGCSLKEWWLKLDKLEKLLGTKK